MLVVSDAWEDPSLCYLDIEEALTALSYNVNRFGPFHFAWDTGLTHTVSDEARLVLGDAVSPAGLDDAVHNYLVSFGLERYQDVSLNSLSGGWAKYVLYSLFLLNSTSDATLLLIDLTQYLDDDLIGSLLSHLSRRRGISFLAELDPAVLEPWSSMIELAIVTDGTEAEHRYQGNFNVSCFSQKSYLQLPRPASGLPAS